VAPDVENVLVRGCTLMNSGGGSALEIGHEVRCEHIRNISFRDCDILAVHGHGAALSINNGERATISDVLYEDIRVEHYYDMFLNFRVMQSRYSHCPERGRVRNLHLKNVRVAQSIYNPGYSLSVIGGVDEEHTVDGVVLEDVYFNDRKITAPEQMDLFTLHARNIEFQ
jgi:hypothetical protein